jgi:hypothetical protein
MRKMIACLILVKRFAITTSVFGLLVGGNSFCQSGAVVPEHGAGHAEQPSCVILKRMGPADQVTSRLYSFGVRGKQFQYVEGKLPDGFPFHGRLTDHDVRNLQARNTEVIVLNQNYSTEELGQARADCQGQTGKSPNQAEVKATPGTTPVNPFTGAATSPSASAAPAVSTASPASGTSPAPPAAAASAASTASAARLSIASNPNAADIEVDGSFVGNTPSEIEVTPGDHTLKVSKAGFKPWERKFKAAVGSVHINAELEPQAK